MYTVGHDSMQCFRSFCWLRTRACYFSFSYCCGLLVTKSFLCSGASMPSPHMQVFNWEKFALWGPHMTSPEEGSQLWKHEDSSFWWPCFLWYWHRPNWRSFFLFCMFRVPSYSIFLEWCMESIRTRRFTTWAGSLQWWSSGLSRGRLLILTSWQTGKIQG